MKKIAKVFIVLMVLSLGVSEGYAQIVVRVRPEHVVVRRSPPPSPHHVWIEEDWVPQGRSYAWRGGYWAVPPRQGAVFVPGHWKNRRFGYVWIPGHWR